MKGACLFRYVLCLYLVFFSPLLGQLSETERGEGRKPEIFVRSINTEDFPKIVVYCDYLLGGLPLIDQPNIAVAVEENEQVYSGERVNVVQTKNSADDEEKLYLCAVVDNASPPFRAPDLHTALVRPILKLLIERKRSSDEMAICVLSKRVSEHGKDMSGVAIEQDFTCDISALKTATDYKVERFAASAPKDTDRVSMGLERALETVRAHKGRRISGIVYLATFTSPMPSSSEWGRVCGRLKEERVPVFVLLLNPNLDRAPWIELARDTRGFCQLVDSEKRMVSESRNIMNFLLGRYRITFESANLNAETLSRTLSVRMAVDGKEAVSGPVSMTVKEEQVTKAIEAHNRQTLTNARSKYQTALRLRQEAQALSETDAKTQLTVAKRELEDCIEISRRMIGAQEKTAREELQKDVEREMRGIQEELWALEARESLNRARGFYHDAIRESVGKQIQAALNNLQQAKSELEVCLKGHKDIRSPQVQALTQRTENEANELMRMVEQEEMLTGALRNYLDGIVLHSAALSADSDERYAEAHGKAVGARREFEGAIATVEKVVGFSDEQKRRKEELQSNLQKVLSEARTTEMLTLLGRTMKGEKMVVGDPGEIQRIGSLLAGGQMTTDKDLLREMRTRYVKTVVLECQSLLAAGRYDEVEQRCRQALEAIASIDALSKDAAALQYAAGHACVMMGRLVEGIGYLEQAVGNDPDSVMYLDRLTIAYLKNGDIDKAEKIAKMKISLREQPQSVSLLPRTDNTAADTTSVTQTGQFPSTTRKDSTAVDISSDEAKRETEMGDSAFQRGQYEEAITHYEAALKGNDDICVMLQLGLAYENSSREDRQEKAVEVYRRAIKLQPENAQANLRLAQTLYARKKRGDLKEVIVCARKAVNLGAQTLERKELAVAHDVLGRALYESGKWDEGMAEILHAVSLDPTLRNNHPILTGGGR